MYFRGSNQMAINIINLRGMEFFDSTNTIILLYSFRLFHLLKS
ncbi:unnamed protein product [Paramecium sonneborni]|uniref:Uncharacterized protein n=1 Tax=Paramecium sonneborni TaxID=65129 RepID=A0A8S1PDW3_9CILI|nr:unnamed protein product [Paramecium sonneborni]